MAHKQKHLKGHISFGREMCKTVQSGRSGPRRRREHHHKENIHDRTRTAQKKIKNEKTVKSMEMASRHFEMVCVAIHAKSPAKYNLLRQSGLLPLRSFIHKYVHFCKAGVGFTPEIMKHVAEENAAPSADI